VANLIEKNDNAINFNAFYMKTINKGVLSMFINFSTFTKNPTSCPKVQLRYSPVFCFFIPQGINNKTVSKFPILTPLTKNS